jgi:hypothetical protein
MKTGTTGKPCRYCGVKMATRKRREHEPNCAQNPLNATVWEALERFWKTRQALRKLKVRR